MSGMEKEEIRQIVASIIAGAVSAGSKSAESGIPVEMSARHVHLTKEAVEALFGPGHSLRKKRELSQPGQYLSEEQVKLVTMKGSIDRVSVLGPERKAVQVEVSLTDARTLGIKVPVNLSGDLTGAGDVILVGPYGTWNAKGSVIAARAHVHMTPADARSFAVRNGEEVSLQVCSVRSVTLEKVIVRVDETAGLAAHIDTDEANACSLENGMTGRIRKKEG